jgi:hypothetical protein
MRAFRGVYLMGDFGTELERWMRTHGYLGQEGNPIPYPLALVLGAVG